MRLDIKDSPFPKGPGFWKYNTSLNNDQVYILEIKKLISNFLIEHASMDKQAKLELLKFEIKKFSIKFSKEKAKLTRINRETLEKNLESMLAENVDPESEIFKKTHEDLEKLYDEIAEGIRIRSKCNWYELGEKSTKYFLNLEKKNAKSSTITKLDTGDKIISNHKEIFGEIEKFYTNLFKNNNDKSKASCKRFLDKLSVPMIDDEDRLEMSNDITKEEIFSALSEMSNERSPGNDGLPAEFYKCFWDELKDVYFDSISLGRLK